MVSDPDSAAGFREKSEYRCVFQERGSATYSIEGLPDDFFDTHKNKIKSAETLMKISYSSTIGDIAGSGAKSKRVLKVPRAATIDFVPLPPGASRGKEGDSSERRLVQNEGNSSVLVIRVTDETGAAPTKTAAELSDDIFGTSGDKHNFVSVFHGLACRFKEVYSNKSSVYIAFNASPAVTILCVLRWETQLCSWRGK